MKRFLITTADERSWIFDGPVLFLGEWCRLYERRHIWGAMNASVAKPYGLQPAQKNRDWQYVQMLTDQLQGELTVGLNGIHRVGHDARYWQIVTGHWLRRHVATLFNRYHSLEVALNENDIAGSIVFDAPEYELAVKDSISCVWAIGDPIWNHVLYSRILEFLGVEPLQSMSGILDGLKGYGKGKEFAAEMEGQRNLKKNFQDFALRILSKLSRKKDAFIINSYLPMLEETLLQISLGQVPQLWRSPRAIEAQFDLNLRKQLIVGSDEHKGFELFIRRQLPQMIPTCFLEGYEPLEKQVGMLPWPSEPKFVFTSNNFEFDEIFKLWVARKAEKGVPYFTGQHGNNYGTYAGLQKLPEITTCDKFFTWGWSDSNPKNVAGFAFTIAGRTLNQKKDIEGLLLVEQVLPPQDMPQDKYYLFGAYQEDQFRFVEALPERIRQQVTVRLYKGAENSSWSDRRRWQDRNTTVRIDSGAVKIAKLIACSRLVVYSYDSTGLLESLALNMPTICFWRGGLDHLLPVAKPYYELLRDVGIIMDTPEQAASKVTEHWDQIDEWWENDALQAARKAFCEQYAKTVKNPVRTLKRLLTAHSLPDSLR